MDPKREELLIEMVQQIAKSEAMQHAGRLYEIALNSYKSGLIAVAVSQLQAAIEIGDPFYVANALWSLAVAYRHLQDKRNETATLERILSLPPESRRFIDPENLGVAHLRIGDARSAVNQYLRAISANGRSISRSANLTEALLVEGDYVQCLEIANTLVSTAEPQYMLVGRIFKGAALWFLDKKDEARTEFQFVGDFLVSAGGIIPGFRWDFSDSEQALSRLDSPQVRSILALLSGKIDFATFRQNWMGLLPSPVTDRGKPETLST
jgi:tetratricopeptide (TPR) repeat protein